MLTAFCDGAIFGERQGPAAIGVVALHGWGRGRADLAASMPPEAGALLLDLPGHGASPPPPAPCGTAWYAERIRDLIGSLPTPPVLVGHSFGGRVALRVGADDRAAVRALVLTGVPLYRHRSSGRAPLAYRAIRRLHRLGLVPEARLDRARGRYGSADYRAASGVMRDVLVRTVAEDYTSEIEAIARRGLPTHLVWGRSDTAAPLADAERAAEVLGAELTVVDAGHDVPAERPDVIAAATREALA